MGANYFSENIRILNQEQTSIIVCSMSPRLQQRVFTGRRILVIFVLVMMLLEYHLASAWQRTTNSTNARAERPQFQDGSDAMGYFFSSVGYRPHAMVRYIARTSAWKEGRCTILDWGCGGGGLSQALVQKGAQKVVAVDMSATAAKAAQRNLEPYAKNVTVERRFLCPPDWRPFDKKFDLVVSFMGALNEGTSTDEAQIDSTFAMELASEACREGGLVIVAHVLDVVPYVETLAVALAGIAAWLFEMKWLWNRSDVEQYMFWVATAFPLLGFRLWFTPLAMGYVAESVQLRQWRWQSVFVGLIQTWRCFRRGKAIAAVCRHSERSMELAGLTHLKRRRRILPFAFEPLDAASKSRSRNVNWKLGPMFADLHIFEGKKE